MTHNLAYFAQFLLVLILSTAEIINFPQCGRLFGLLSFFMSVTLEPWRRAPVAQSVSALYL